MFLRKKTELSMKDCLKKLKTKIEEADAVIIGAGAGLSTSAGFTYSGERFEQYFGDFKDKYGICDMYSGGFYPFDTPEEFWAWWSRQIYYNRYVDVPKPTYQMLYELIKDKDYFVLTTNVDHQFQKHGFDKKRLFYTQGDYGLFQCSKPCCDKTFDNETMIMEMMAQQKDMKIPTELVPKCPYCGRPLTTNLRADDRFVQDEGWYQAAERYDEFCSAHRREKIVYLELGVGYNTPGIIKYPFWRMTMQNPNAAYVCINKGQAACPSEIKNQSICIDGDIDEILSTLMEAESVEGMEE